MTFFCLFSGLFLYAGIGSNLVWTGSGPLIPLESTDHKPCYMILYMGTHNDRCCKDRLSAHLRSIVMYKCNVVISATSYQTFFTQGLQRQLKPQVLRVMYDLGRHIPQRFLLLNNHDGFLLNDLQPNLLPTVSRPTPHKSTSAYSSSLAGDGSGGHSARNAGSTKPVNGQPGCKIRGTGCGDSSTSRILCGT